MQHELLDLMAARNGHVRLESGHHGDLWLDLDGLFQQPGSLRRFVVELTARLSGYRIEAVCGPLTGGALLALMIALELDVELSYAERTAAPQGEPLYSARYRIPSAQRRGLDGKRIAIVDDVINAGSAVRSTYQDLLTCGAKPVVVGALLVLGPAASEFALAAHIPLVSIAQRASSLWLPSDCPLCASGVPVEPVADVSAQHA